MTETNASRNLSEDEIDLHELFLAQREKKHIFTASVFAGSTFVAYGVSDTTI